MNEIPFTQYIRPSGHPRLVTINRPATVLTKASALRALGYRFECEVLATMDVSLTIVHDDDERGDVAVEICQNGPDVLGAVDRLIMNFEPL